MVIHLKKTKNNDISIKIDKPIAFVLGRYITGGLGVVRCLGRRGIPVIWLDSNPHQTGFHSKYCKGIVCPHPKHNEQAYVDFLLNLGKKLKQKGVLFPIGDIEVIIILKHRKKLEKFYHIPMTDYSIAEKLVNKQMFYETLKKLDIPHPKTYIPQDIFEVEVISKKIAFPCIIKPSHSAYFVLDFNTKLFRAENPSQLVDSCKKALSKNHEVVIQEAIPGNVENMYGFNAYYDKNHSSNSVFMYRRIREWPHDFGNGCLIESINVPELEDTVNSLIKKIRYHGIVDAEFRKDPRDNMFKLIEINARCWMQCSLPARCGVNIPYIAYMMTIGKKIEKPIKSDEKTKWIYMPDDFRSAFKSIKDKELSFGQWIFSYYGKKEYAIFSWEDPMPFFVLFAKAVYGIIPYIKKVNHPFF